MQEKNKLLKFWTDAVLHSYSQIFFSLNKLFAVIILAVTFFDPCIGTTGLLAVVFITVFAHISGLNKQTVQEGIYGFNALLLGIALGYSYQLTLAFWILFLLSILLLLVITVGINGFFEKNKLPFLAFPFLFSYWIITSAATNFTQILPDTGHLYQAHSSSVWYSIIHMLDNLALPRIMLIYFKTLNGIFFQDTILGGILICTGLLIHSRISFSLSIIGFFGAYWFFQLFGANTDFMSSHLIGSNFILMAIAIGGFFIVPNVFSYLMVILLTPVLIMLLFFFNKLLSVFQLSGFTLAFSILVTLFLYFLHQRWMHNYLQLVTIQYYSAEKTIYKYLSSLTRFENAHLSKIALPFWGIWKVSQGYDGSITHLGEWSNALDFVITDERDKTYKNAGSIKDDFYCYNKPVLAPMEGYVHSITNTVDDNDIASVNTSKNWGNTIILSHANGLYSQISHLKKDSFKVGVGDYVSKGSTLATCGNSGRSPEPHIHLQFQQSPKVGEKTIPYPIAYFIQHEHKKAILKTDAVPQQDALISNVETTPLLINAFNLIPGKKMAFRDEDNHLTAWEVFTDAWNRTYIYCSQTQSYAYFANDETMFYFYDFEGDKESVLFHFYLAFYRILLGYYQDIQLEDKLPLIHFNSKIAIFIQDFLAPFYLFTKATYRSSFIFSDNMHSAENIEIKSTVTTSVLDTSLKKMEFDILIKNDRIHQFSILRKNQKKLYLCEQ